MGLLPWTFFSNSMSSASLSLTSNLSLLNKVYCPREVFPIATIFVAGFDMIISSSVLVVLCTVLTFMPSFTTIWALPAIWLVQIPFMVGLALILSAATVYMRDLRHGLPILLQIGLFATPVAYGMRVVPKDLRWLYSLVNPLAPVIEGYRRVLLEGKTPQWGYLALGGITAWILLIGGYKMFKRLETGIADVA
jgi:ABC-2 type transport system permease protein/lipopolysaccharide transport system permease protein